MANVSSGSFAMVAMASVYFAHGADQIWWNSPPTTLKGCTCTSECYTRKRAPFHCDVAEFCQVSASSCTDGGSSAGGKPGWTLMFGYWDWCNYESYGPYEQRSAIEKETILMDRLDGGGSGQYASAWQQLGLFSESVRVTMESPSDVFPDRLPGKERKKLIHSVGVTGGIRFVSNGKHYYKGLFEGSDHGIVRFSAATKPSSSGMTLGMAIKFLRDGRPSANLMSMYSLDGQSCKESNFFAHDWTNHMPPPSSSSFGPKLLARKFWQGSNCPTMIGLSDWASTADGVDPTPGSFPFKLVFKPALASGCECTDYDGCLHRLSGIAVGTKLFDVEAMASPGAPMQSIGHVTLTGTLKRSKFGDEELFFKHQPMEDDFGLQPQWLQSINMQQDCGTPGVDARIRPHKESGCSEPMILATNLTHVDGVMLDTDVSDAERGQSSVLSLDQKVPSWYAGGIAVAGLVLVIVSLLSVTRHRFRTSLGTERLLGDESAQNL